MKNILTIIGLCLPLVAVAGGGFKYWADNTYVQQQQLQESLTDSRNTTYKEELEWLNTLQDAGKISEQDTLRLKFLKRRLEK
jgi:hypothetical protein